MLGSVIPRITPAWAGKSRLPRVLYFSHEDHPRVGGEKPPNFCLVLLIVGSPPRGRGKVTINELRQAFAGITPAWAGKSQTEFCGTTSSKDHPRVGGEKTLSAGKPFSRLGSPPRGRGKGVLSALPLVIPGITPAWAGKRGFQRSGLGRIRDHPRVGGEKTKKIP